MSELIKKIFPDTKTIQEALAFTEQYLDEPTLNHVIRSSLFSTIIVRNLKITSPDHPFAKTDVELVVVSNLLHDMAWNPEVEATKKFISQDKRFEVDGANAAREFLKQIDQTHGWDQRRIQLVWDAIALHATPSIAWHKEPEVAVSQYGIATDIFGMPGFPFPGLPSEAGISREEFDEVYKAYPGLKLAQYLKKAMCALCTQKPESTFESFVSGYGEEYVAGYTLKGKRIVDQLQPREAMENQE